MTQQCGKRSTAQSHTADEQELAEKRTHVEAKDGDKKNDREADDPATETEAVQSEEESDPCEDEENDWLSCSVCDREIIPNSSDHDECMTVDNDNLLICGDCPWKCPTQCGSCTQCDIDYEEAVANPK